MRELFLALEGGQFVKMGKRESAEGDEGGIYTPDPGNSRWAKGYPETPGNPNFSAREQHPDTPGNGVRSIRPYTRSMG